MTTDNVFSTYDITADLAANRPATPTVANGRLNVFFATDTGDLSFWDATNSKWRTKIESTIAVISLTTSTFTPSFGSYNTIPLDTVEIDTANGWNSSTHAYTVPITGKYLLSGSAGFQVTTASLEFQVLAIWKNGTGTGKNILSGASTPPVGTLVTDISVLGSKIISLTAGDVLTLAIFMQGSAGNVQASGPNTYLTIQRVA